MFSPSCNDRLSLGILILFLSSWPGCSRVYDSVDSKLDAASAKQEATRKRGESYAQQLDDGVKTAEYFTEGNNDSSSSDDEPASSGAADDSPSHQTESSGTSNSSKNHPMGPAKTSSKGKGSADDKSPCVKFSSSIAYSDTQQIAIRPSYVLAKDIRNGSCVAQFNMSWYALSLQLRAALAEEILMIKTPGTPDSYCLGKEFIDVAVGYCAAPWSR